MEELPATFILKQFNFDTLATKVYQFVLDEYSIFSSFNHFGRDILIGMCIVKA